MSISDLTLAIHYYRVTENTNRSNGSNGEIDMIINIENTDLPKVQTVSSLSLILPIAEFIEKRLRLQGTRELKLDIRAVNPHSKQLPRAKFQFYVVENCRLVSDVPNGSTATHIVAEHPHYFTAAPVGCGFHTSNDRTLSGQQVINQVVRHLRKFREPQQ